MGLVALSTATLALLHDEPWQVVGAMAGLSLGVGFSFAAMAALITEAVDPTETGIATGINTVMNRRRRDRRPGRGRDPHHGDDRRHRRPGGERLCDRVHTAAVAAAVAP